MTITTSITVDGSSAVTAHAVSFGTPVTLGLTSTVGVSICTYDFPGASRADAPELTVTYGGTVGAATINISGSGISDGAGCSYILRATLNGGLTNGRPDPSLIKTVVLGVPNAFGVVPPSAQETTERDATIGWTYAFNQLIGAAAMAGADKLESVRYAVAESALTSGMSTIITSAMADGVTPVAGDEILIYGDVQSANQGTWVLNASKVPDTRRATDEGLLFGGTEVYVREGTAQGKKVFRQTRDAAVNFGEPMRWTRTDFLGGVESDGFAYARVRNAGDTADLPVIAVNPTTGEVRVGTQEQARPTYRRVTELEAYLDGAQGCSNAVRTLLAEATVICPLYGSDRYWDSATSEWKSKNYGSLGDGIILGNATQANSQLNYADRRKGCRLTASAGVGAIQIPAAWIAPDGAFTVLVRYQRPAGVGEAYSTFLTVGDVGAGSGYGRIADRLGPTDYHQQAPANTPGAAYSPRVMVYSASTGGPGSNVNCLVDGTSLVGFTKGVGTLSGRNHLIGGFWSSGTVYSYKYWCILDVIIVPRTLSQAEMATLTRAVQFPDAPEIDILTGQSNMVGPGLVSDGAALPPLPNPRVSYVDEAQGSSWNSGWGPANTTPTGGFGPEVSIAAAKSGRYLLKYAYTGMSSDQWIGVTDAPTLALADALQRGLLALSCKPVATNIVFLQGETDAGVAPATMTPDNRRDRLIAVAGQLRFGLNRSAAQCRFVIPRLNSALAGRTAINSLDNVRAGDALFAAADTNAAMVDLDGTTLRAAPDVHYSSAGIVEVGTRIAAAMQ